MQPLLYKYTESNQTIGFGKQTLTSHKINSQPKKTICNNSINFVCLNIICIKCMIEIYLNENTYCIIRFKLIH